MADTPAQVGLLRVLGGRTVLAVEVILILLVPFVVFAVISGQATAASWAPMGGVVGLMNLTIGGAEIAYLSVGLLTALTPVAIVSGAVPVAGAGLMAIMCCGVGLSAARGLHRGTLLIPMYLAFMIIAPPAWSGHMVDRTSTSYLLWIMLFLGGGGLWAVLVFPPMLRKRKMLANPKPWAARDTLVYTVTITVLCTASTLAALIWWPGSDGGWLIVTLLAITQFGAESASMKRTLSRIAGTIVGVVIASIVASVVNSEAVLLGIGFVLLVISVVIMLGPHSYVLYSAFITPTVVLFNSASIADVHTTDVQRLVFTLIAAVLLLLASGIALSLAHYEQTHDRAHESQDDI
jgi:hypothetical protein